MLEIVNVRAMLGRIVDKDKSLLSNIFLKVGGNEFVFIKRSGFYFGFVFGIIQVRCGRWPPAL